LKEHINYSQQEITMNIIPRNIQEQRVMELDLEPHIVKLTSTKGGGEGWSLARALKIAKQYRAFLILHLRYPDETHIPTISIDTFWHTHILDTMKYMEDCDAIFGSYFHHFPYVGLRGEEDAQIADKSFNDTVNFFDKEFGMDINVKRKSGNEDLAAKAEAVAIAAACNGSCTGACSSKKITAKTEDDTLAAACSGSCTGACSSKKITAKTEDDTLAAACSGSCTGACSSKKITAKTEDDTLAAACSGSCTGACGNGSNPPPAKINDIEHATGCSGACTGACSGGEPPAPPVPPKPSKIVSNILARMSQTQDDSSQHSAVCSSKCNGSCSGKTRSVNYQRPTLADLKTSVSAH
jgi:hypothetical protein